MKQIDYSKLNDRIVEQACNVDNLLLTDELKTRLFQNKIARAVEALESRKTSPIFHTER